MVSRFGKSRKKSNLDDLRAIPKRFLAPRFLALTVASSRWLPSAKYSFLASDCAMPADQLYEFAAYGLTVTPYAIMSFVNLVANLPAISTIVHGRPPTRALAEAPGGTYV